MSRHNPEAQQVRQAIVCIAGPKEASNIVALMDAIDADLLRRPDTPAVKEAKTILAEAKSNVVANTTEEALEDFKLRLYDISDSFHMMSEMPKGEELARMEAIDEAYFGSINLELGLLPRGVLKIYYQAYLAIAPEQRVPLETIKSQLKGIATKYAEALSPANMHKTLVEAFGKLVNGQTDKLVGNDVLSQYATLLSSKISAKQQEIEGHKKGLAILERIKERSLKNIGRWVKTNHDWYEIFSPSHEPHIKARIENLNDAMGYIAERTAELRESEKDMLKLKGELYLSQYEYTLNNGEDTTRVLLDAFDALGDDVPESLRSRIEAAKQAIIANPESSEFDKLFYGGEYSRALALLARQNEARNDVTIPSTFGKLGEHDILAIYEKYKETGVDDPNAQYLYSGLRSNSFAARKVKEGYKAILVKTNEERPERFGGYMHIGDVYAFLVKEYPDGRIGYMMITLSGSAMPTFPDSHDRYVRELSEKDAQEYFITPEKQKQIHSDNALFQQNLSKIVATNPRLQKVKRAGEVLQEQFGPLQTLIQGAADGNKTQDFVDKAKEYARALQRSNSGGALAALRMDISNARRELASLRAAAGIGIVDEFEANIQKLEKSFNSIVDIVDDEKVNTFLTYILSDDFEPDTCGRWILKTALPFFAAIAAAVGAIALAYFSLGTLSGVSGMIIVAAAGTIGGIIGNEVGVAGGELIGKAVYGDAFTNETMLMKAFSGAKYYDENTKTYKEVDAAALIKTYGSQFFYGFVSTFIFLGLGKLLGNALASMASRSTAGGVAAWTSKMLNKIPGIAAKEINLMTQGGFKETFKRLGAMYLTELAEETAENAAGKVHPFLGYVVSVIDCLDGGKVSYKFGKYDVVASGFVKTGENSTATFTFDAKQAAELEADIRKTYGDTGTVRLDNGSVVVEISATKGGPTNTMIFSPSTESGAMRQMFSERGPKGAKSRIEVVYGVARVKGKENVYTFSGKTPAGEITLAEHLKRQGFVINGDPKTGRFEAVKGDQTVSFVSEGRVVTEEKARAETRAHEAVASSARFTGDELVELAGTDPYVALALLENVEAGNMTLTLGQLSIILGKFESAGVEVTPEHIANIMAKMPGEFEALATQANIDQVIEGAMEDVPPIAKRALRAEMKVGSALAGAVVLLYSNPAAAATAGGVSHTILATAGGIILTGVGWLGLGVYLSRTKWGKEGAGAWIGKWASVPIFGLVNAFTGKYGKYRESRAYAADIETSPMGVKIAGIAATLNASEQYSSATEVVTGICNNYLRILEARYDQSSGKQKAQIEGMRTQFNAHLDALISAQNDLTTEITKIKEEIATAKHKGDVARAEALALGLTKAAKKVFVDQAAAADAEMALAQAKLSDPKFGSHMTNLGQLFTNLQNKLNALDAVWKSQIGQMSFWKGPGVRRAVGLAAASYFSFKFVVAAVSAALGDWWKENVSNPLGDLWGGLKKKLGLDTEEQLENLKRERDAVTFEFNDTKHEVKKIPLKTALDSLFTNQNFLSNPEVRGREAEIIGIYALSFVLRFMIFTNKNCKSVLEKSGSFDISDINIWYAKARKAIVDNYTLPNTSYIKRIVDLLPETLTLEQLNYSIHRKTEAAFYTDNHLWDYLTKIKGVKGIQ